MALWFVIVITLCLAALIKPLLGLLSSPSSAGPKLPPGPLTFPLIGNLLWLRKSFTELEPILRSLHSKHGPMVTLHIGPRPTVFVSSRSLAHQALVQNGAAFADRPPALLTSKILSCDQHNINSAFYGPTWRVLRRNLTAEILHPARVRSYSRARRWVLDILLDRLRAAGPKTAVRAVDHFQYAMFCLLVLMCFGDRLEERQIREVEEVQRGLLLSIRRFAVLNYYPRVGRILFRRRWEEFHQLRRNQKNVLLPLIRARSEARGKFRAENIDGDKDHAEHVMSYVDTLLNLELPPEEGKRKLTEAEMVSLCSEFLNGGTDTTSTALQWIMANIVKYPEVQETLYSEIRAVVGTEAATVEEEDLQRMPYLKAVVLEGLRRHPPGHFVLPHSVTEDIELGGYLVPKKGSVNFMVAEMGWDPTVWEDPMAFKPERFLSNSHESGRGAEGFDITGSREIKMMPFGVGRRICPGFALALLHLEYFLANLVWAFEWRAMEGDNVDLSEKQEFTIVMKNPLHAIVCPRLK
ncbi:cytochrome P450 89A2-like [Punica granatum]|uniref:Cytochrome P450 89A2-like n=2 Tax=Punica granatum TaxID=22663 RepID=A0A6P8E9C7_PUNGR|nr:cytochrome P450 89A2-like [Punica granatum]